MKKKGKFILFALISFLAVFIAKKVMKGMFGQKDEGFEDIPAEPDAAEETPEEVS